MREFISFLQRMMIYIVVSSLLIILLLLITDHVEYITGWLWGCGTNIVYMVLLSWQLCKNRVQTAAEAVNIVRRSMVLRLSVIALLTFLAFVFFEDMNHIALVLGLLVWRPFVIYEHTRQLHPQDDAVIRSQEDTNTLDK